MDARQRLREARRIVVKVGTSTLAHDTGMLNLYRIDHLLRELADLMNEGREIILVSSGAIAAGLSKLGLAKKPDSIPEKQAVAAIGQGVLMHIYEKFFAEYGKTIGQVLLTKENAVRHHQYRHSRDALLALLAMGPCQSSMRTMPSPSTRSRSGITTISRRWSRRSSMPMR